MLLAWALCILACCIIALSVAICIVGTPVASTDYLSVFKSLSSESHTPEFELHLHSFTTISLILMLFMSLAAAVATPMSIATQCCTGGVLIAASANEFPSFLPKQVENVKDSFARKMASRIQRLPVELSGLNRPILSSCVKPMVHAKSNPLVLLHGFDSSCLEWRYTFPLLEDANLETWVIDILGWGFSDLESRPACSVVSKRDHLHQFWKSYIQRPMILVGPSLGAAVAIDFTVKHPEAVEKLILIDASVYVEGTANRSKLPKAVAYAGAYILKSVLLRFYATNLSFNGLPFDTCLDWTRIGRLHCLLPWWVDTTVDFIMSGGYSVRELIKQVKQETLIIWGEDDQIIDSKLGIRLHCELTNARIRQIPNCGHIPHVEKPNDVARLIEDFIKADSPALTV